MDNRTVTKDVRRYNSYLSTVNLNYNFLSNPWIPTMWSFTFPGFGHLLLGMYLEGYLLVFWEIVVNSSAHLNEAMMYSFIGKFELAKEVLNFKWALLYIGVYVFAAWDSYRSSVDTNKINILARNENAMIVPFKMSALSIAYLEQYPPRIAAAWSFFMPGVGQFLIHRLPTGFIILFWWMLLCYLSNFPLAIFYTLTGSFELVPSILVPKWFLYMPSIYVYSMFDAYFFSVEFNKLFKVEQATFLKREYQNKNFKIPRKKRKLY
ncbi:MAG: hypothetical protein Q8934_03675 [Bacillota bacterium]|nr:hypothetical protein [Bacillota bacterium]